MSDDRIHRAVSADGAEIAGRVHGQGPALVLVHGAFGDGEFAWDELLPRLTDRFTCYTPSARGRGLSAEHPDHSPPRVDEDITAFVGSIGEPVCLFTWSNVFGFDAAAKSGNVAALASYESGVLSVAREDDLGHVGATFEQIGMAAADGRLVDAVHAFTPGFMTDGEIAALEGTDFFQRCAGGIPAMLTFLQHYQAYEGPRATDPETLERITAPVLAMVGEQTRLRALYTNSVQYIAEHVADGRVHELPGVGHFAPVVAPETLATELISFFGSVRQPA